MKRAHAVYWHWCWAFHRHPQLCLVLQTIFTLSLKQRKEWLALARTQSPPIPGSYLATSLNCLYDNILVPSSIARQPTDIDYLTMTIKDFLGTYLDPFLHPISASVIALATRISPTTTQEEYDSMLLASVSKELSASITRSSLASLDFRCIFDSRLESRDLSFSERLPPSPEIASDTYTTFCRVRESISGMLIFPSIGRKTVGSQVAEEFWNVYYRAGCTFKHDGRFDPEEQVTTRDCLKLYEITGGYLSGPVEVRSSWKYAQIAPRIYYARGGSVIPTSQYLQPVINRLIDAFPETHRINRFSAPSSILQDTDVEVIYDYSSFTSSIDTIVEFVDSLSVFFRGTLVQIVDVRHGVRDIDLGDLLLQYNRECNEYASFDTHKVLRNWCTDPPILQHTCGMLGVEGNIFLATLLHGIHLRFIAGLARSRCVGDDARLHYATEHGRLSREERHYLAWILSGIGDIELTKMGIFEFDVDPLMQAYRYVKRPIHRDQQLMIEGLLFDIPSLVPLMPIDDDFHTVLPSKTHPCRSTFKSIIRMLRLLKVHRMSLDTHEEEISVMADHIQYLLSEIRKKDPKSEHSPHAKSDIHTNYRIPSVRDWGRIDYEDWILDTLVFDQELRFLKRGGADETMCDGRLGSRMIRKSSGKLSFLEKMGYVRKVELFDVVSLESIGPDEMRQYLLGEYPAVCEFEVIEEIPPWYAYVPGVLMS